MFALCIQSMCERRHRSPKNFVGTYPALPVCICHEIAHVEVSECRAPEFFANGTKVLLLPGPNGKIEPAAIERAITRRTDIHYPKPRGLTLTQATEARGSEMENPRLVTGVVSSLSSQHSCRSVLSLDDEQRNNTERECRPRHNQDVCH
jgi:hypothetical protein